MPSTNWNEVAQLFDVVAAMPADQRVAYLQQACAGSDDLRKEVESLLSFDGAPLDPLEHAGLREVLAVQLSSDGPKDISGEIVGPYKLIARIAVGGMSEVYLGVRADGEFEQQVAIKLVGGSLDSEAVLRRYKRERRTLASLAHPNIAKLFDAGVTGDGRPYLVMEYIDGVPIDQYCDTHRLTIRQRFELVCDVCSAVQYAHENLVVHRDLKPSNILVTKDGTPMLLDFGIARVLTSQDSDSKERATATLAHALTPDYASPEQIRGEPIATTSDVYSLGVVLYELLVGHRPYSTKGLSAAEAERIVCTEEPVKPSMCVTQDTDSTHGTSVTHRRRALRGDLDTIVLKALRKEPRRRYRSVEGFSVDIRRYLSGQPITARKDTVTYRSVKFVQRNKTAVAAAGLIAVILSAAVIGIGWQAQTARRAERLATQHAQRAEAEAQTAQQVTEFLIGLFEISDPKLSPQEPPTLRDLLDRSAEQLQTALPDEPAVRAELICILGRVYQNLGLFDEADQLYASGMKIRRDEFGPQSVEVALSLNNLGVLDIDRSNFPEAIRRLEIAVRIYDTALNQGDQVLRLYRAKRADVTERNYATSMANLGLAKMSNGELDEAKPLLQRALQLIDQLDLDDITLHTSAVEALASVYTHEGNYAEAETLFRNSLAQRLEYHGDDHPLVATTLNNLATVVMTLGRYAEAVGPFERSLEIRRAVYGDDHPAIVTGLANLGTLHSRLGKYEVAQRYLRESLELAGRVLPQGHTVISQTQYNLATVLLEGSEYEAAERIFREVLTAWRAAAVPNQLHVAKALNSLGRSLVRQERLEEAEEMIDEAITIADPFGSAGAQLLGQGLHNKATIATIRHKPAEAERLLRRTLEICFDVLGQDHPTAGLLLSDLGWSLHMQDRNDEAVKTLRQAYQVQQAALGVEHPNTRTTVQRLESLGASMPDQIPE